MVRLPFIQPNIWLYFSGEDIFSLRPFFRELFSWNLFIWYLFSAKFFPGTFSSGIFIQGTFFLRPNFFPVPFPRIFIPVTTFSILFSWNFFIMDLFSGNSIPRTISRDFYSCNHFSYFFASPERYFPDLSVPSPWHPTSSGVLINGSKLIVNLPQKARRPVIIRFARARVISSKNCTRCNFTHNVIPASEYKHTRVDSYDVVGTSFCHVEVQRSIFYYLHSVYIYRYRYLSQTIVNCSDAS